MASPRYPRAVLHLSTPRTRETLDLLLRRITVGIDGDFAFRCHLVYTVRPLKEVTLAGDAGFRRGCLLAVIGFQIEQQR